MALEKVDEVRARGKVPVVVGGTNYYIESILFENHVEKGNEVVPQKVESALGMVEREEHKQLVADLVKYYNEKFVLEEKYNPEVLHQLLQILDPQMAQYLHTNDQRRVINALLKFFKHDDLKESDI
eukprot:CAMPEP_0202968090 /NCGR_PEP_ID=MMETSP1396-20130829/13211_1 /ASSEMBLY_ACC=CAM_ASM_000872 /TAXON_ID= /ORGANISM="Pseudokeronopsis sp., Strain Brazil" /LENGTH=125 /DNA_ID=CAMNT_0049693949 /DNA_START=157 /DNA_END=534 /DNA_ORIENTATION=+